MLKFISSTKIRIFVFCLFFIRVFGNSACAQIYDFRNYSVSDGLLQSTVNDIKQDKNSFLWIATDGGLSRFDGIHFKSYSTQNGLSETAISTIVIDAQGAIWLGTVTGKIYIFENEKFTPYKLKEDSLCKRIISFFIDSKNNIWAATEGLGAIKIEVNKNNKSNSSYNSFYNNPTLGDNVHQVFEDTEGMIWFTTQNGIRRFNQFRKSFEIYAPSSMPKYYYTSISQAKDGRLVFGSMGNGVCLLNNKNAEIFFYDESNGLPSGINPFAKQDADSNLWVSSWNLGLTKLSSNSTTNFNDKNGLPSNKVRCMFQDNEGNIWFGTQDNGIIVYKGNKFNHFNKKNGLTDNVINTIKRLKNKLFVGTNNGLNIIDNGSVKYISTLEQVGSNLVTDIVEGNNQDLYISTFQGSILVINSKTLLPKGSLQLKENLVNALYFDENAVLWVATNKGISFFKNNDNLLKAPVKAAQLDDIEATSFFKDSKNNLWIGTRRSGLIKITNNQITYFTEKDGLKHKSPTNICEDENGIIWIGTEGGGIYTFVEGKFTNYNVKNGLISDFITTINFKNNAIWVGTNKGIGKYDLINKNYFSYNQFDGFNELEVKPHASYVDGNKIWYGTINGLVSLNINELIPNKIAPKINLSKFEVFGKEYLYPKDLVLNYRDKDITFHFTAISYKAPEKVVYQYKLVGLDDNWHTAANTNIATYTNLVYGNYTLQIKAMNGDGVWGTPTEYSFEINAPFWMKKWFWILVVIIVIALVVSYGRMRRKKLIADKVHLEHQVKERTKEIQEKNGELVIMNVDISLKNKEITDSINYAKRLQDSILPRTEDLEKSFKNIFVLYKPKSIVSGDFYWYTQTQNQNQENEFLIAAADCTGHGVPGAFMCMVATSLLNQIVVDNKIYEPSEVLKNLNNGVRSVLKQQETETRDGMDIALCRINIDSKVIEFAGALRPLYLFRDFRNEENKITDYYFEEIKPNKYPIGGLQFETVRIFDNKKMQLNTGDTIYMFSDGFADQFGGNEGKKLMTKKFKEILHSLQPKPLDEQRDYLNDFFNKWCGEQEQIDDVMVIGIRF
jgi:ligand-binding sensor domain-containing protein/serine phosphatase RsbU (regulator of sigma subunit)